MGNEPATVLVLRNVDKGMTSHGGFVWPASGPVEAPDWSPEPRCGKGLHGWLWGIGDHALGFDVPEAWLVVEVAADSIVDLHGKVKYPRGTVIYCGDMRGAVDLLRERAPDSIRGLPGEVSASGNRGASTSGYRGASTSGDLGASTSGDLGASTSGYRGASTSGALGIAAVLDGGVARGKAGAVLVLRWWCGTGQRWRVAVAIVGETPGVEADAWYRVVDGAIVRASDGYVAQLARERVGA